MPELAEVETVRRDLDPVLVGRRLSLVDASGARSVRRYADPAAFADALTGRQVVATGRLGKYLVFRLDGGDVWIVHLRMSGQLLLATGAAPKHTHVELTLDDGLVVRFVDPRTFGEMWVAGTEPSGAIPDLAHIGPDAWTACPSARLLAAGFARRRTLAKSLLLDQGFIAGLGNIYADEVLHRAGIRFDRRTDEVPRAAITRLHGAIGDVLGEAIEARGSTLGDQQYVDISGRPGRYGPSHRVYGREGQPCLRCGSPIVRARFGNRSAYSCLRCQR